jgi:MraZ protein
VGFELRTGTFESTLDDKGRVVIPAPLRERYTGKLVITQGKEKCVWVMPAETYEKLLQKFKKIRQDETLSSEEIEAFLYQHESTAFSVEIDQKTGRIPVPAFLRTYANLAKECLVVSINNHLEIWNADYNKIFMEEVRLINKNTHKKLLGKVDFFSDEDEV